MNWIAPISQMHDAMRRKWRIAQRKRRAGLPYREKMSPSESARYAALVRHGKITMTTNHERPTIRPTTREGPPCKASKRNHASSTQT